MRKRIGWIQTTVIGVVILGLTTAGYADHHGKAEGAPTTEQQIRHGHLNGIVWARQWINNFSTDGFNLGALMDSWICTPTMSNLKMSYYRVMAKPS